MGFHGDSMTIRGIQWNVMQSRGVHRAKMCASEACFVRFECDKLSHKVTRKNI